MSWNHDETVANLGVVSFLNSRPLIDGLDRDHRVRLHFAVPARLPDLLRRGEVEASLIPVIDLARERDGGTGRESWQRVGNAGIGCDGETLTVRVFSRVPPEQITTLHTDDDSHTSIALARIIWKGYYRRCVRFVSLSQGSTVDGCQAVLLIGDKVVTARPSGFDYEIDLGGAWKQWTGLPFVFAVWAAPAGGDHAGLARLLNGARDRGVARAAGIAAEFGPPLGWAVALAEEYLTRRLTYTITPGAEEGMRCFLAMAAEEGIVPARQAVRELTA